MVKETITVKLEEGVFQETVLIETFRSSLLQQDPVLCL